MERSNTIQLATRLAIVVAMIASIVYFTWGYRSDNAEQTENLKSKKRLQLVDTQERVENTLRSIYRNLRTISLLPEIRDIQGGNRTRGQGREIGAGGFDVRDKNTVQQLYNNLASSVSVSEVYCVIDGFKPSDGETPFFMYDELILKSIPSSQLTPVDGGDHDVPIEYEGAEYAWYAKELTIVKSKYPVFTFRDPTEIPAFVSPLMQTCDNTQYESISKGDVQNAMGLAIAVPFYDTDDAFRGFITAIIRVNVLEATIMDIPFVPVLDRDFAKASSEGWGLPKNPGRFVLTNASLGIRIHDRRSRDVAAMHNHLVTSTGSGVEEEQVIGAQLDLPSFNTHWQLSYIMDPQELADTIVRPLQTRLALKCLLTLILGTILLTWLIQLNKAEIARQGLQEKLGKAQRMESLGLLAGGVAHDLNNLLGPVIGYSELLVRELPGNSKSALKAKKIGKSAEDAAAVIQDLLTLARRGRYEMQPLNLNRVVRSYLESPGFEHLKQRNLNTSVAIELSPGIASITGSEVHLSKVIMNLVVNAFEAMPTGGTLSVESETVHLDKLYSGYQSIEAGEYVVFRVRDTGHGIAKEDISRIFEPYFSKKQMGQSGSGLGLSVVYGVVKDHKGHYDVKSEVGKGTEFVLYFPTSDSPAGADKPAPDKVAGGSETVLIIDDSPNQRDMAQEIIESFGYSVLTAVNGHEAVELLRSRSADLIVLDMIMEPGFDGLDTYIEILKIHSNQKAVIVSGFSATERVQAVLDLGATAFVRKPYNIDTLARAIRSSFDSTVGTNKEEDDHVTVKSIESGPDHHSLT